jgi:large-conductance mechanosensitive channel
MSMIKEFVVKSKAMDLVVGVIFKAAAPHSG